MSTRRPTLRALAAAVSVSGAACADGPSPVVLASTTSTYDSGLLDTLVARFREARPDRPVRVIVAGSGETLELARRGDADIVIVHAPAAEERFMAAGHVTERALLMRNDFLLVGPPGDPAGIGGMTDPASALARIAESGATFVSRGDSSGTHERELALWREAGAGPARPWYVESGQGQGTSLQIASERRAYTLTDRATFVILRGVLDLVPLVEGHPGLLNVYSVILPTAAARPAEARVLADWLLSAEGQRAIGEYRLGGGGERLFAPAAEPAADAVPAAEDSAASAVTDPASS